MTIVLEQVVSEALPHINSVCLGGGGGVVDALLRGMEELVQRLVLVVEAE